MDNKEAIINPNSILDTIKKMLGPSGSYDYFDTDIIVHINSAIAILSQNGLGPKNGFIISNNTATWQDLILIENFNLSMVQSFIYIKVKLAFTPPNNSYLVDELRKEADEYLWRIQHEIEINGGTSNE